MTEGRYQYEPHPAGIYPEHWTNAEEQDYQAYLLRDDVGGPISRQRWRRTYQILEEVRQSVLESVPVNFTEQLPTPSPEDFTLQTSAPAQRIIFDMDITSPEPNRNRTEYTDGLQARLDAELLAVRTERAAEENLETERQARINSIEEQLDTIMDEMNEVASRLEGMEEEAESDWDSIESYRQRLDSLEELYNALSMELGDLTGGVREHEVRNPLEELVEPTPEPEDVTVRGEGFRLTGRNLFEANIQTHQLRAEPITANPIHAVDAVDWGRYITASVSDSLTFSTTSSTWKPRKRYKFDTEKINNTVNIIRALQLILKNYSVSEEDVEKFNLKDLVIEE